ncbi:MAG: DNA-protecting protein DprA [Firmicutes bacterium]|jgi:DNA processing protein|nr:DNA-protecting protein DprA [Bacillota bacterium]
MLQEEALYWLALSRAPGIGPRRFFRLLEAFGSAGEAWTAPPALLAGVIGWKLARELLAYRRTINVEEEWEKLQAKNIRYLLYPEEKYPRLLKKIPDPPPVLYYSGDFQSRDQWAVAVVGSRSATPGGVEIARELAAGLAAQGITVVSGLARGIDTAAHRGALAAGGGRTIAVLGSGLDRLYPRENTELAREINRRGAVCSEFPPGTEPLPGNFPVRNRIISGLSLGVVVVEAAADSGSLITAGHALEQGREVFAVPGPVARKANQGSNRLIKQGAALVEGVVDILTALNLPFPAGEETAATAEIEVKAQTMDLTPAEARVWQLLAEGPCHIDQLVRESGLPASEVGAALALLEMKGLVSAVATKTYQRLSNK